MKDKNPNIVVLPEIFNCTYDRSLFEEYSEKEEGNAWKKLSKLSKEQGIYLFAGSIPEKVETGEIQIPLTILKKNQNK